MYLELKILLIVVVILDAVLVIKIVFASKTSALFFEASQKAGSKKERAMQHWYYPGCLESDPQNQGHISCGGAVT